MKSRIAVALILVVGWLGLCVYAYPGYLSFDSVWQLREARSGVFTDWHPPAMAALWRVVELVVAGPFGMLLLQSVSFLAGTFLLLRRYISPIAAAVLALLLLWYPPVGTALAVIWKDSQMVGYLLLGTALLGCERRGLRVTGLVVLALASAMRHNAPTITFSLVVVLFLWSPLGWRRYAIALLAWLAITAAAFGVNRVLTVEETHPWHGSLGMFDLVGILRYAPPMTDAELRPILAGTPLEVTEDLQGKARAAYSPVDGVFRIVDVHYMRQPTSEAERDAIARAWKTLVLDHFGAYLRHRWHAFADLLALPHRDRQWVWVEFVDKSGADLEQHAPWAIQETLQAGALWFGNTWLMRPSFYLLLVLALLPFAVRQRHRLAIALAASAILSEAALFFLSPTPDFRYSLWLVPCAFLMTVLLVAQGLADRATSPRQ